MASRVAQMFIIEWSGWRPDTTLLNVIDATANKAELPSLMGRFLTLWEVPYAGGWACCPDTVTVMKAGMGL